MNAEKEFTAAALSLAKAWGIRWPRSGVHRSFVTADMCRLALNSSQPEAARLAAADAAIIRKRNNPPPHHGD